MADRSNYADKVLSEDQVGAIPQHRLAFDHNPCAYTPTSSERDIDGTHYTLASDSVGDWSWQPWRYQQDPGNSTRVELEAQMPTYRPNSHSRACKCCGRTACLSLIADSACA